MPVVYVNSRGSLEYMPGKMGAMMQKHGFRMNGLSKIYALHAAPIETGIPEAVGAELELQPRKRGSEIRFHGQDILSGNWLFKQLILKPDTKAGLRSYEQNRRGIPVYGGKKRDNCN